MEAARVPREADVAPAPASTEPTGGRLAGWTPADPGPLGLAAFAGTTFILSLINANLISGPLTDVPIVLGLALAYGGIAQLIAGIWEFRTGNTFGAVAFCSYGAFWISFYIVVQVGLPGFVATKLAAPLLTSHINHALGAYLWMWGIFTTYMFVASLRTTGAVALVFLLLAATFIILGIGNSAGNNSTIKVGGYVGLATAIAAWYASFAAVFNSTFGRAVIPVFPLSRA